VAVGRSRTVELAAPPGPKSERAPEGRRHRWP
jgi:hypothetical protein